MMQRWRNSTVSGDLTWLLVSVLLASGVWYIAVTSADPIDSRRFQRVPVQLVTGDAATVIMDNPTRFVSVTIQGPQGTVSSRRTEDIVVRADLTSLAPGTHSVPLNVEVADPGGIRSLVAQTQPSQIAVRLEPRQAVQKETRINITRPPPIGFRHDKPATDVFQVVVSGAESIVADVAAVQGDLDLSDSRNPIETSVQLYAMDAAGERVDDVELDPPTAPVAVNIDRRDDVRQIPVRPVLFGRQPDGFTVTTISSNPESLFIGGTPEQLARVADTLFTQPINLENRQADFEEIVPVRLPQGVVVMGDSQITVSVGIEPIATTRQFGNIEVLAIGLDADYAVSIEPGSVSAIVHGPESLVEALLTEDIQVIVDLDSLSPGIHETEPSISINRGGLSGEDISLLPKVVNVEITSLVEEDESAEDTASDAENEQG